MIPVILLAVGVLVGITLATRDAHPQPAPQPTTQEDCGCGVPASPRGPR